MSSNPVTRSSSTTPTNPPPAQSGVGRLIVLLVLLAVAIGALAYDYLSAGPGIEADDKKLEAFVDELNKKGVTDSKRITPEEIHNVLGRQPTWVDEHPDEHYEVEYYCKWGSVPLLGMRRHYIAVIYVGDEPRRYNSHHKNEKPPLEALPIQPKATDDTDEAAPAPEGSAGEGKAGEATPDGAPAEGKKKGKGKKKQEAKQEEKQEEKTDEKPAEKQEEKKAD
ncbi:MAG TPA: hypothetical protein VGI40_03885 [Pirellulaceae bacterium]|jgi:hypothetical protein